MVELDFGCIYNATGKVVQLRYAQKAINKGSTIIGLRNSKGVVLIVSKPITSKLHVRESNHRIQKIADNVFMAYTGLLPSGFFIASQVKKDVDNYKQRYNSEITIKSLSESLSRFLYLFTQYNGLRVVGANFLAIVREENRFALLAGDCSGKVTEYSGFAYGIGSQRAQTEIEKLELESLEINELVENGIRTLYKCHDALSDPEFSIEVGIISNDLDGEFIRMKQEHVDEIAEKYKDLSIDEDE